MGGSQGFAYLFERFPSFTQTFCVREVLEMRRQGVRVPIWSIRDPRTEPKQDFSSELDGLTAYLPDSFSEILRRDTSFRRKARKAIGELCELWGGEGEKRRIYEALWLLPELQKREVEHVHTHFAGTALRTAFWLSKLGGIRYSFTAHANDIFCDEARERLQMLIRDSQCCITVSDFSKSYLDENFPLFSDKIFRVYNGIHPELFHQSVPSLEKPLILAVGRYIEKKGFGDLIAACRRLQGQKFEVQIVGQGPLESVLKREASGDSRIEITGPKSEREIIELMGRASVFVLPCVNEGDGGKDNLPTVIMEAMAAGVPVISTPVAGVPEMVVEDVSGHLVPPRDPSALAECLMNLLDDPRRALEMGMQGKRLCQERFATARTTEQLRGILARYGAFEIRGQSRAARLFGR